MNINAQSWASIKASPLKGTQKSQNSTPGLKVIFDVDGFEVSQEKALPELNNNNSLVFFNLLLKIINKIIVLFDIR